MTVKFRTGTLYSQELAHLSGRAASLSCLLCHQPDSRIHMLSGSQMLQFKTWLLKDITLPGLS